MTVFLDLDRRGMLQHALTLVGATAAVGMTGPTLAKVSGGRPILDPSTFKLLSAVADTILPQTDTPGAVAVGVPKSVDRLLANWASPARRLALVGALKKIDALALETHRQSFTRLSADVRYQLLSAYDKAALVPSPAPVSGKSDERKVQTVVDPNYGKAKQEPPQVTDQTANEQTAKLPSLPAGPVVADADYAMLKELIVVLYYFSETALTKELAYDHSPGAWQPSIKITPGLRPQGGAGIL